MKKLFWKIFIWPFLNDEEPIPRDPTQWAKYQAKWGRFAKFYWLFLRNPLHNFSWHVIGIHGKVFTRKGINPAHNYAQAGGWQYCVISYKWLKLPYISFINRKFRFCVGWTDAGSFSWPSFRRTRPDIITW